MEEGGKIHWSARRHALIAPPALALLASVAWWWFGASGPEAAPGQAPTVATTALPAAAPPGDRPRRDASDGIAELPDAEPAPPPAQRPPEAAAMPETAEAAPETSIPGRSLAELERRARAGEAKAARDWVDALGQCIEMLSAKASPAAPRFLRHLDLSQRGDGPKPTDAIPAVWAEECHQLFPDPDREAAALQAQTMREDALRLWAATGDPFGQLAASTITLQWPPPLERWRQQQGWASAYLDPANPQTLVDLAQTFAYGSRFAFSEAWLLAACDLGYDCAAGGALQMSQCQPSTGCPSGSYEEELLQSLPPRQWQLVQGQRRELLQMLRHGDTRGVFDIPPPGG